MPANLRIVIVTGGRDFVPGPGDAAWLRAKLLELRADAVIHGAAKGADTWAGRLARAAGYRVFEEPVTSRQWRIYGDSAGPRRNGVMLQRAQLLGEVVACVAFPGGRGTADMKRRARHAGVPVVELEKVEPEEASDAP